MPIGLCVQVDQHSFLQLIMGGLRDKTLTFIKIEDLKDVSVISKSPFNKFEKLVWNRIEDDSFNKLLNM